mmetsp:Transcript_29974/g.80147  ORF Transcript_29974/g.80147 Transcript_29974/m.80147 type:complete len:101 (+) Transcript_29974:128-430(+)
MVEKLIHYIAGYIKGALAVTYKEVVSSESRFGTFKSDTEEKIYKIVYKIIEEEEQKRRHAETQAAVCLWVVDKLLEDCKLEKLDDAMIHLKEARHEKKGA